MIVDGLNYWVKKRCTLTGFASTSHRFLPGMKMALYLSSGGYAGARSREQSLRNRACTVRLIAEAWDPVSYQLGRTFPGISWLQWNGMYRDDVRAFVKGEAGMVSALMTRLYGSNDLFPDDVMNAYHAYQSVNFVTCHDGFCLYDLVAYNQKHNEVNGHNNSDGADHNLSWNCGWEGDENVPGEVIALRKQQVKNFCCLLFLSNGTPMFRAGDEFMNTQRGNT